MAEHSKLPWVVQKDHANRHVAVKCADGYAVTLHNLSTKEEANAELIATAVNSHYEMLEALEEIILRDREYSGLVLSDCTEDEIGMALANKVVSRAHAKAAIAKAKPQ